MAMTPLAHGRIEIWQGGSLWVLDVPAAPGAVERTDFHAHHALQVTLELEGTFELLVADRRIRGPAAVVAADVRHAFQPKGSIALLFVEPESAAGRVLTCDLLADQPFAVVEAERVAQERAELAAALHAPDGRGRSLEALGRGLLGKLAGGTEPPPPDARIDATRAWAVEQLDRRLGISEAASRAGLSVDRMSHLFVEHTGLPFRTYLLWLRLTRAVERYAAGASLTEAAHEAGFADSPHLSRTFRRMFGVAPAVLDLAA